VTKVILVAHGKLAYEMKNSAEMIFGKLGDFYPIAFTTKDGFDSLKEKITKTMDILDGSILIITDLFAGTPFNASSALVMENDHKKIEVISGMSLPLVLETATMSKEKQPQEIVEYLKSISQDTVRNFVMEEEDSEEDEL